MSDLPTREWAANTADDVAGLWEHMGIETIVRAYAESDLMTRDEWLASVDIEAFGHQLHDIACRLNHIDQCSYHYTGKWAEKAQAEWQEKARRFWAATFGGE